MEPVHIAQHLEQKNSALQKQGSKLPATGEERGLQVAIQSKRISQSSLDEIKEVLRLCMIKIGLRSENWPNDLEKLVLFEHIVANFGGNRIEEIKLAFDMAIAGSLDDKLRKGESVHCYENFSCLYFSSIMNAFRRWSSEAIRYVSKEKPPEQIVFTDEQNDDVQREDAERQYQLFLKGNKLKGIAFNAPILVRDGFIKETESVLAFFELRKKSGIFKLYEKVINDPSV